MSTTEPPRTAPKPRVPFWDNARFACIVLVVLGHAVQRMTYDSDAALALYLLIYAFHMPAFAVLSGYFSKAEPPTARTMGRLITDIVAPYLIFEVLWTVVVMVIEGRGNWDLARPSWTLWFLLALALFRLLLPYLALLRWPLLWTVAISLGAGYVGSIDTTLSLSRALGLLPFFLLGWWLRQHRIMDRFGLLRPPRWWVRVAALAVLVTAGLACWAFAGTWRSLPLTTWMFYRDTYADLGADQWWASGIRLVLMVVALILIAAFLTLVPRRQLWWTDLGQYTLYVYLLHSFVLYPLRESGVLRGLDPAWLWLVVVVAASVLIAMALSSAPVRAVFRPLIEPRLSWLFADPTVAGGRPRAAAVSAAQKPQR
ncbi:acyltransferase family protein [Microbacterium sp.]|uniref:acyltransferase family protein n=1 Tax=Microbacterium sp. TaxID=51671 RepID=UPI003A86FFF9